MIRFDCEFDSVTLATKVNVTVFIPNRVQYMHPVTDFRERYSFNAFKVLYLLHGMWDSGRQWIENTDIVRLAQNEELALVIPSCGNNFYVNTIYGARFSDFVGQELPGFIKAMFPVSDKREDNFICGMSMGGYGALRLGFVYPGEFSKVIALSPTADIVYAARFMKTLCSPPDYIIGSWKELKGSDMDLFVLADKAAEKGTELPEMLTIVGDRDHLIGQSDKFYEHLTELGFKSEFRSYPGEHSWDFWSMCIPECLRWLLNR